MVVDVFGAAVVYYPEGQHGPGAFDETNVVF
jgi:hypothetical protein